MHPLSDDIKRQTYIDQTRISHIVTQCNFDGDLLKGTVESAKTLVGKDFQGMIRQGTNVAFSMRGLGGVSKKQGNYNRIDGPLHIISYDWVMFPSHHNAYMQKVVSEDVNILDVDKQMLMEGATFNLNMKDLAKYVAESSNNVKELSEHTGFQLLNENTSIDIRNKTLDIQQGGDVLKVFLEDQIHRELDSYFGSMKFKI